jgi:hypothetical protein
MCKQYRSPLDNQGLYKCLCGGKEKLVLVELGIDASEIGVGLSVLREDN